MADPQHNPQLDDSLSGEHDQSSNNNNSRDEQKEGQEPAKLFIGQIPRHVSEAELRRLFDPYGSIEELVILRDKHTNAHRGCAFLTYHSRQSADEAIDQLHEKISLHNRPMVVRYAGPHNQPQETKLFVGMLSRTTGEEAIEQLFGKYGGVKEVYLMRDAMQQSKGCAFVKMANRAEAELAIAELNESHQDAGAPRKLVVRFADSKAGRLSAGGPLGGGMAGGGYERGERGMYGVMINGQQQQWPAWSVPAHMQNQYAASLYAAQQAQAQALARQQQSSIRGMYSGPPQYYSREQHLHLQHMQQLQQQQQQQQHAGQQPYEPSNTTVTTSATSTQLSPPSPFNPHQQQQHNAFNLASLAASLPSASSPSPSPPRGPPGSNLFVYNIPDSYTDDDLLPLFSPYGAVVSVKVYRDKLTGVSRGFGFVSYADSAAAERAIQALNGMQVNGKRLKVMLKKQSGRGEGRGSEAAVAAAGGSGSGSGSGGFDVYANNNTSHGGMVGLSQQSGGRVYVGY